jgi:hypothetical protein
MHQVLNTILQLLQQGIAAIFKFFELIYNWALSQIILLMHVPISTWPLWKQVLVGIAAVVIIGLLVRAAMELWEAGETVLGAFVTLLRVLVLIMPWVLAAGVVAFSVLFVVNNLHV